MEQKKELDIDARPICKGKRCSLFKLQGKANECISNNDKEWDGQCGFQK